MWHQDIRYLLSLATDKRAFACLWACGSWHDTMELHGTAAFNSRTQGNNAKLKWNPVGCPPNHFKCFKVQAEEVKTCQGLQKTGKGSSMNLVPRLLVCWFDAKSLTIKVHTTMRIQN